MSDRIEISEAEGGESPPPANPILRVADGVFAIVGGIVLFGMMAMTAIDVFGRYFFNAPLGFAFELTQLAMAVLVFAALPSVTLRGQHVTVGLFENAFTGRGRAIRDTILALATAICCAYLAWRLSRLAGRFVGYGEITTVLRVPIGYVAWFGVFALYVTAFAAFIGAALSAVGIVRVPGK